MSGSARYLYLHPDGRVRRYPVLRRRVRLRLAATRRINTTCCWLVEHGRDGAAVWLWRACGLWLR